MNGIILIDKPSGPSSMDIVRRIRKALGVKRAGHSGTLDPAATGLLIVAVGHATRVLPFLPLEPKTYQFDIVFGSETDTLDSTGTIVREGGYVPGEESLRTVIPSFVGDIQQKPPRFSALKIAGVRAYLRARKNENFDPAARTVHIESLQLRHFDAARGRARMEMRCHAGTYVRSLARDIAGKLSTLAHAADIRRTALGPFSIDSAVQANAGDEQLRAAVRSPHEVLGAMPAYIATAPQLSALAHGKDIDVRNAARKAEQLFVYDNDQKLIAVARRIAENTFHPLRVFEGA